MFYRGKKYTRIFILTGFMISIILSPAVAGDINTSSHAVRNEVSKTMEIEKKIQKRENAWAEESVILNDLLARLGHENKYLEAQTNRVKRILALEEKKNMEILRKKKEAQRVRNELISYLDSVLIRLEDQINHDLPFLTSERQARIKILKEMMVDKTESSAEKFRRIFEALQIETEYGSTIEASRETISFEGSQVLVNIFRLGRVSLFCQTIDKKKSGYFNINEKKWMPLPENTNRDLTKAIAMARLEQSIELVKLPLGRIIQP